MRLRVGGLCLLLMHGMAFAANQNLAITTTDSYRLVSRGIKVVNILKDLGANYGLSVVVSNKINDVFVGSMNEAGPEQVLDRLSRLYGLAWYFDGEAIYVYQAQEVATDLVTPIYMSAATVSAELSQSGRLDDRFCRVRVLPSSNALEVFGVPICIERINRLAKRLDEQALSQDKNQETVRVFPLKYASADDGDYVYRGQRVVVPGVVSVLREMAQSRGLAGVSGREAPVPADRTQPFFSADSRQNAVIVRDQKSNIKIYENLIPQLDRKPTLIEISVAIIDVDATDMGALGVDWTASAKLGNSRIEFNAGMPDVGGFSTVISNTGNFMVRLSALEQHSKAKVLSRPSLVTLNNVQAVLDRNITFYTKVSSEKTAKLESISTGSLLRVTPRLFEEQGQQEVMLTLNIQDGRQGAPSSEVEFLPQVLNSEIATQASLKAGQSLLLGGFIQDEQVEGERKIPLLGDIPILGRLFSSKGQTNRRVVRLFLIKAEPITKG